MPWFTLERSLLCSVGAAGIISGVASWIGFLRRRPLLVLPPQRCRAVPWGAGLCLVAFLILWLPQSRIADWLGATAADPQHRITATLQASLLAFPIQFALCMVLRDLVLSSRSIVIERPRRVIVFVALGLAAWLAATPLLLGLQFVVRFLTKIITDTPQAENALITILRASHEDARLWWLITAEAVIFAPLREELFFRGCIQPWLVRQSRGGAIGVGIALFVPSALFASAMSTSKVILCCAFVMAAAGLAWLALPAQRSQARRWPRLFPPLAHDSGKCKQVYFGIVGTAIVFAVFHAPSWPDPIPLVPLGMVLGWLAWRTQNIIASVVCHAVFNATSLLLLRLLPDIGV